MKTAVSVALIICGSVLGIVALFASHIQGVASNDYAFYCGWAGLMMVVWGGFEGYLSPQEQFPSRSTKSV